MAFMVTSNFPESVWWLAPPASLEVFCEAGRGGDSALNSTVGSLPAERQRPASGSDRAWNPSAPPRACSRMKEVKEWLLQFQSRLYHRPCASQVPERSVLLSRLGLQCQGTAL